GREVGAAVMQHPFHADVWILAQVVSQRSDQLVLPEGVWHLNAERPARVVASTKQLSFHFRPAFQQLFGVGVTTLAITGELHAMRRAVEQLQAKRTFQRLQATAGGRLSGVQLRRGCRKAASLNDANEGTQQ